MKKLKGVAVGTGYFSHFHYEAWTRIPEIELVAVCGISLSNAQEICNKYGFKKAYDDVETMLKIEQPDFIDIITPPNTHLDFVRISAKHNINIICQKPLAPSYAEALKIVSLIKNANVRMMVHENFRFQPWHRELKKLLDKKVIGNKLHTINLRMRMGDGWQDNAYMDRQPYFRNMEKLLIYETGIHFIDVFRYLGGTITKVYAKLLTLNKNIKGEDFAWVNFSFDNGMLGFLDANRFNETTAKDPRLTFGEVLIEGNLGSLRLYEDGRITTKLLGKKENTHHYDYKKINFAGDCVFKTQKHFVKQLIACKPFETDVVKYLENLIIQNAIYESNFKSLPIEIKKHFSVKMES